MNLSPDQRVPQAPQSIWWTVLNALCPVLRVIGIGLKFVYRILFGWLDWWMQQRANHHLGKEVLASLYFWPPDAVRVKERTSVLPFDYAQVQVLYRNICLTVVRGRGELNVSLSPRHAIDDTHELGNVIAAVESRRLSEHEVVKTLADAIGLIRPRLEVLDDAFSERQYGGLKATLRQ